MPPKNHTHDEASRLAALKQGVEEHERSVHVLEGRLAESMTRLREIAAVLRKLGATGKKSSELIGSGRALLEERRDAAGAALADLEKLLTEAEHQPGRGTGGGVD